MNTIPCFTYGSLMCEDIMSAVCGAPCRGEAATLPGYSRHPVLGEEYPGMRPAPGSQVAGSLYRNLDEEAQRRLDAFEGPEYERSLVQVQLPDGRHVDAWTYVYRAELAHRLGAGDWDFDAFLRHGKARFESLYVGYDALRTAATKD